MNWEAKFTGAGLKTAEMDEDDLPLSTLRARLTESTGERALDSDSEAGDAYFPLSSLGLLKAPLAENLRALVSRMESGAKRLRSEVLSSALRSDSSLLL
jgi:hypothetical protein